jgi:hypothetical protein
MAGLLSNLFDPSTYSSGTGGGLLARLPEWAWRNPDAAFPQAEMPLPTAQPAPDAAPAMEQPVPQMPAQATGGLGSWLGSNSNALIGLGAGIAAGGNVSDSIAKGLQGLMSGRQTDQRQAMSGAGLQALMTAGLDPRQTALALAHPELMKLAAARLFPNYRLERAHGLFGAFDPATGGFRPLAAGTPQDSATTAGGIPPMPSHLPPGSAYSASRNIWRRPDGTFFDPTKDRLR